MNTNQRLVRTSFLIGFGIAILLRFHIWLFKRRIAFLKVKTISFLLIGGMGLYYHIDTLWVRFQWWLAVDDLEWKIQCLRWETGWKEFLSYWDGFFTGAGWGLLVGIAIMIMMRRQKA